MAGVYAQRFVHTQHALHKSAASEFIQISESEFPIEWFVLKFYSLKWHQIFQILNKHYES